MCVTFMLEIARKNVSLLSPLIRSNSELC